MPGGDSDNVSSRRSNEQDGGDDGDDGDDDEDEDVDEDDPFDVDCSSSWQQVTATLLKWLHR